MLLVFNTLVSAAVIMCVIAVPLFARSDTSQEKPHWQWNAAYPLQTQEWKHWLERLNDLSSTGAESRKVSLNELDGTAEVIAPLRNRPGSFDAEVSVSWDKGARAGGCSLILDVGSEARYVFTVMAEGQAVVALVTHDANGTAVHETISSPRFTPAALQARQDRLTVRVRGQKLVFLLNNEPVAQIADTMMQSDWILGVLAQGHRDISLDNLLVERHLHRGESTKSR